MYLKILIQSLLITSTTPRFYEVAPWIVSICPVYSDHLTITLLSIRRGLFQSARLIQGALFLVFTTFSMHTQETGFGGHENDNSLLLKCFTSNSFTKIRKFKIGYPPKTLLFNIKE